MLIRYKFLLLLYCYVANVRLVWVNILSLRMNEYVSACVAEPKPTRQFLVWLVVRCDHGYSYPVLLALLFDVLSGDVNIVVCYYNYNKIMNNFESQG